MSDLVKRLRAPAYWFSESDEGHPGENSAPREAADRIEAMDGALTTERALTDGAHRRARAATADRDAWKADAERLAEALQVASGYLGGMHPGHMAGGILNADVRSPIAAALAAHAKQART